MPPPPTSLMPFAVSPLWGVTSHRAERGAGFSLSHKLGTESGGASDELGGATELLVLLGLVPVGRR